MPSVSTLSSYSATNNNKRNLYFISCYYNGSLSLGHSLHKFLTLDETGGLFPLC